MPRKKSAKRTLRREDSSSMNNYQRLEKEFMGIPVKFAAQVKKNISFHKQKENKLKKALQKSKKTVKAAEAKLKMATKQKSTFSGKKQFKTYKQAHADAIRNQNDLMKQLSENTKLISTLTDKHAKLVALNKHLKQFDKDWASKPKQSANKKSRKSKHRKSRANENPSEPVSEQPNYETPETAFSNATFEEETEAVS